MHRDVLLKTVVVPVDRSASSFRAVPAAAAISRVSGALVEVVGVAIEGGDAVGLLLERADEPSTVLCLASDDGQSVASELVARAVRPFLVVGPNVEGEALGEDVVVAIDTQHDADHVLWPAARWAVALDAPLRIVTVLEPPPSSDPCARLRRERARLRRERARLRRIGLRRVDVVAVADGSGVATALAEHLAFAPALLLVAGGRRGGVHQWPGVLRELVRTVTLPVLVIPAATARPAPSGNTSTELLFSP